MISTGKFPALPKNFMHIFIAASNPFVYKSVFDVKVGIYHISPINDYRVHLSRTGHAGDLDPDFYTGYAR